MTGHPGPFSPPSAAADGLFQGTQEKGGRKVETALASLTSRRPTPLQPVTPEFPQGGQGLEPGPWPAPALPRTPSPRQLALPSAA